jgi:hypothetical protein
LETIFASLLILLTCIGSLRADEPADSLAFSQKRRLILASAPDERQTLILGAAEDLARDGFYAEALELIFELEDTTGTVDLTEEFLSDTTTDFPAQKEIITPSQFNGYIQSYVDYDDWEGQDEPYAGRGRAKLEWAPAGHFLNRITSVFQTSNRNVYFDFFGRGEGFGRMLKLETEVLTEKKLWQTYGDSLDRIFLQTKVEGNTRPLGKALSVTLPIRGEVEQFRFNRFGTLSSQSIWSAPGLEAVSEDLRKSLILSWEMNQVFYPSEIQSGNFRHGPVAWAEWYGNRLSIDAESRFQTYRYVRDTSLFQRRELETRASAFVRTWSCLKVGVRTIGASETDNYRDSVDLTTLNRAEAVYQLKGSTWSIEPQMVWEWASTYSLNASVAYGRGNYPVLKYIDGLQLEIEKYLDVPYEDWRPSLSLTILSKTIFLNLAIDYQTNTVPLNSIYSMGSSRGMGFNSNMSWKFRSWMEIDFSCMVERTFTESTLAGRIQNMTSLSLGITSRFP